MIKTTISADRVGLFTAVPPVNAVEDPQARAALEALSHIVREIPSKYATMEDAKGAAAAALDEALAGAGGDRNLTGIHEALERLIMSSDLWNKLAEPIKLEMRAGVADRLNVEARARAQAILDEANNRANLLALETAARIADVNQESADRANEIAEEAGIRAQEILDEAYARGQGDGALQIQINTLSAASTGDMEELIAAVQEEAQARIDGDAAEASQRNILATQMRGAYTGTDPNLLVTGLVYEEKVARSSADGALAVRTSALEATVNTGGSSNATLTARIAAEETARASADAAEVSSRQALSVKLTGVTNPASITLPTLSSGLIYDEKTARTNADGTIASSVSTLQVQVNNNYNTLNSAITTEQTTRANADSAQATQITGINARLNNTSGSGKTIEATIIENKTTAATETAAVAYDLEQLEASVGSDSSAITDLQEVTQEHALALQTLDTRTDAAESNISTLQTTTANQAISITSLTTRVGTAEGNITELDVVTAGHTQSIDTMSVTLGEKARVFFQTSPPPGSLAHTNDLWLDSDDKNKTYRWSGSAWVLTADVRIADNVAAIATETQTRIDEDEALAGQITALTTRMGSAEGSVTTETTTRVQKDNALAAAINNMWANIGSVSTAVINDGQLATVTPTTAVATAWIAVKGAVTDPNTGQINSVSIKQELNTYAGAVNTKLSGTYSVRAEVSSGGLTVVGGFGLMGNVGFGSGPTIDFGVRADKFFIGATSATPSVPAQIGDVTHGIPFIVVTSPQYVGDVLYPTGVYLKETVFSRNIQSDNYVAGVAGAGWRMTRQGGLEANTGTFRGALGAATGTFSGSLTANAINAVDSINVRGNAIGPAVGAQTPGSMTGVSVPLTITAADIPTHKSTVTVLISAGMTQSFNAPWDVGVNMGNYALRGNLATSYLAAGCWAKTILWEAPIGSYVFASYNPDGGPSFVPPGGGGLLLPTIVVQLAKR